MRFYAHTFVRSGLRYSLAPRENAINILNVELNRLHEHIIDVSKPLCSLCFVSNQELSHCMLRYADEVELARLWPVLSLLWQL